MAQDTLLESKAETMAADHVRHPLGVKSLVGLQVLLALVSIPPGVNLLQDPTGSGLGIQFVIPTLTQAVPFVHDFAPVGLWLIVAYGVVPLVLAAGLWGLRRWARYGSTLLGAVVAAWIGVELAMFSSLGFTWFYPLIGGMGLAILALSLMPSVRRALYR